MRAFDRVLETDGNGLWSHIIAKVQCLEMDLDIVYPEDEGDRLFGELRIYFDTDTWDVRKNGLIYTDRLFIFDLRSELQRMGYDIGDLGYSEQGMQGSDFVSFDAGSEFCQSWLEMEPSKPLITEEEIQEGLKAELQVFNELLKPIDPFKPLTNEDRFMLDIKLQAFYGFKK